MHRTGRNSHCLWDKKCTISCRFVSAENLIKDIYAYSILQILNVAIFICGLRETKAKNTIKVFILNWSKLKYTYYTRLRCDSEPIEIFDSEPLQRVQINIVFAEATQQFSGAICQLLFTHIIRFFECHRSTRVVSVGSTVLAVNGFYGQVLKD